MSFHWSIYIASKPRFKLTDGKNRSDVYCVSCFNAQDLEIGNSPNSLLNIGIDVLGIMGLPFNIYYVQIFTNDRDERPWQLLIDNYRSQAILKKYIDCLAKRRSEYYSLVPVTKIEQKNSALGSKGFEFGDPSGKPVAAFSNWKREWSFLVKPLRKKDSC